MILEIADIRIAPDRHADFESAMQRAIDTVASRAGGFRSATLHRGIESTDRYVLQIVWDTVEHHTVGFRQGPLFAEWRALIGGYFAAPPHVEHYTLAGGRS